MSPSNCLSKNGGLHLRTKLVNKAVVGTVVWVSEVVLVSEKLCRHMKKK